MEDKDLERKLEAARSAIAESELHEEHKEALHESLDQAAKSANGSTDKLHDMSVAICKAAIRTARSDISFKDRVADAVQVPLAKMRDDILKGVGDMLNDHVIKCPNQYVKPAPTTLIDVGKAAVTNPWFCVAFAIAAFSPNIVGIIQLFKH